MAALTMPKFNYIALGVGAVFAVATIYSGYRTLDYIASTQTANGVVVRTPIGPHHPDITFTDSRDESITFSANGSISQNVGDEVVVRYRQDNPARSARLDTFGSLWGTTLFLLALAVAFVIAGVRNITPRGWDRKA